MSAPSPRPPGGVLLHRLRLRPQLACVAAIVFFLGAVAQYYQRDTGFSSLLSIGDILDRTKVTALRKVPHYVYDDSAGYDGAYYVQLALNPLLDNPELLEAIDNLPYRAKRMLPSWVAWTLGFGQPAWIVQVHALINVACWLALAWVLFRWFPPTTWENFLRWAAVLFSHGLCMSVRHSLVDGPALLLVALAMRWLEEGRRPAGYVALALAALTKETSLLAGAGLGPGPAPAGGSGWRSPRQWGRMALIAIGIALPLLAWMLYVRLKFGPAEDPGMGNFTLPLVGFAEKVAFTWKDLNGPDATPLSWATLATITALAVQGLFFALRWRPTDRWWRIGASFALMMVFMSTPVWEGYPGAATRVLLPMTLAFNILVPRGWRWAAIFLIGNLTLTATYYEYSPPYEFHTVRGVEPLARAVRVLPGKGWYGTEINAKYHWRWTSGDAALRLLNDSGGPVLVTLQGQASSVEGERRLRISLGERMLWGDTVVAKSYTGFQFGLTLPPGETVLAFRSDRPAERSGTDLRELSFLVANLEVVVRPAPMAR